MNDETRVSDSDPKAREQKGVEERRGRIPHRSAERIGPTVNTWTAILTVFMTVFVIAVAFVGITGMQDLRQVRDEVERIREIRIEMETAQNAVTDGREYIDEALQEASQNLSEMKSISNWVLEEQSNVIDTLQGQLAGSVADAEQSFAELSSISDDLEGRIRHMDDALSDLSSDVDELLSRLARAREELESMDF